MYSKTITSLAMLKANIDMGLDYIDIFVPFLLNIIKVRGYKEISSPIELSRDFKKEYGLDIPYLAVISIIDRAKQKGYLRKVTGKYVPIEEEISGIDFDSLSVRQERQINKLLSSLSKYILDKTGEKISLEEAEGLLFEYIENYGVDILKSSGGTYSIPNYKHKRKKIYLLNKYIEHAIKNSPEEFDYLVDVSLGQALMGLVIHEDGLEKQVMCMDGMTCYLDADIIFNLLGTSGIKVQNAYADFISTLSSSGVKLAIFSHTYNEVMSIFDNARRFVGSPFFDPAKASRTMLYFCSRGFKRSDIEEFIVQVKPKLAGYGINIMERPSYSEKDDYQIDEVKLRDTIKPVYGNLSLLEIEREDTINRDVDSISAIYRLRKGKQAVVIGDVNHVFVTTNCTLAVVSHKHVSAEYKISGIPMCVTDVFIGTSLWASNPQKYIGINKKRFIASVYASLRPDAQLMRNYLQRVEYLHNKEKVNKDEYYLLRTSDVAYSLLQEKTFNDPEAFSDKTPDEILLEIRSKIKNEESKKLSAEQKSHDKTKLEIESIQSKLGGFNSKVDRIAHFSSKLIANAVFVLLIILFLVSFLEPFGMPKFIAWSLALVFAFLGTTYGLNAKDIKSKTSKYIQGVIVRWFRK